MKILKRENWWFWLFLQIVSQGSSLFVMGALLDVYDRKAWYAKWKNWFIPSVIWFIICVLMFIFGKININLFQIISTIILPAMIMYFILDIQVMCQIAAKLNVPGKELYLSSYIWLICIIIPIIGWIMLAVMFIYLEVWPLVMLYYGEGEKYIN